MSLSLEHDACDESHDHERGDGPEKEIESAEQREEEADVGLAHVLRLSAPFRNRCVTAGWSVPARSAGAPAIVDSVLMAQASDLA